MKVNWKYIGFMAALIGIFVLLYANNSRSVIWNPTWYQYDKNPFGGFVLDDLLERSWIEDVKHSNLTLYELREIQEQNLMSFSEFFYASEEEVDFLYDYAYVGNNAIIGAQYYDSVVCNSFGFETELLSYKDMVDFAEWSKDTIGIKFVSEKVNDQNTYYYPKRIANYYFYDVDSSTLEILAVNTEGHPVVLCNKVHKGNLIFSSVPLIFTNYGILKEPNDKVVSNIVSFLDGDVHWTHFYELGRMESDSPFRYILSQPPLKWALYTLLISIVLFMGFKIKREQRVIPVIEPLVNTTLAFVKTISRLYFVQKDHRDLALKKALYFTEFIREHLYIDTNEDVDAISEKVSRRASINKEHIRRHFHEIQRITDAASISASELQSFAEQTDIIVNKISNYKI